MGPGAVNNAVKAIAIAGTSLEQEGLRFVCHSEFTEVTARVAAGGSSEEANSENATETRNAVRIEVTTSRAEDELKPDSEADELKVARSTAPAATAGAIAFRVRNSKHTVVVAMGPSSVNQAVKSVTVARDYLRPNELDVSFRPQFTHVDMEGEQRSALQLILVRHELPPSSSTQASPSQE